MKFGLIVFTVLVSNIVMAESVSETFVQKGLAIETGGLNDVYVEKKAALKKITSSGEGLFIDVTSEYRTASSLENKKTYSLMVLKNIHTNIFKKANILFSDQDIQLLSDSLTPIDGKFVFNCYTSSLGYIESLESIFNMQNLPVVMLDCPEYKDYPGHTLIRWKYDDGSYLDWETVMGVPAAPVSISRYKNNCREIIPGTDAFYSLF